MAVKKHQDKFAVSEYWPIEKLSLWEQNPRSIKTERFNELKARLTRQGLIKPILITKTGTVIGGNMRLRALRELGYSKVWVSLTDATTDKEIFDHALTDNEEFGYYEQEQVAELALKLGLSPLELQSYEISLGTTTTLDLLLDKFGPEPEEDEVPEVDEQNEPASQLGEIYQLGEHRLMCGDSADTDSVSLLMNGKKADITFTDPPYNALKSWKKSESKSETRLDPSDWFANDNMSWEEYAVFLDTTFRSLSGHSIYICCDYRIYPIILEAIANTEYELKHCIAWVKNMWGLGKRYRFQHEFIVYATKPNAVFTGDRSQSDVWQIAVDREGDHKTPKPVALCAKGIKNSTNKDDLVLDLFGGSGTTLMACEQTNRTCYMMELDPRYCDVIRKRYANHIGEDEAWIESTPVVGELAHASR